jgi:hypothetical protein
MLTGIPSDLAMLLTAFASTSHALSQALETADTQQTHDEALLVTPHDAVNMQRHAVRRQKKLQGFSFVRLCSLRRSIQPKHINDETDSRSRSPCRAQLHKPGALTSPVTSVVFHAGLHVLFHLG